MQEQKPLQSRNMASVQGTWGIFPHTLCSKYAFSVALPITNEIALSFVGLAYQGKDIVFRFSMEYSSLTDFGPSG